MQEVTPIELHTDFTNEYEDIKKNAKVIPEHMSILLDSVLKSLPQYQLLWLQKSPLTLEFRKNLKSCSASISSESKSILVSVPVEQLHRAVYTGLAKNSEASQELVDEKDQIKIYLEQQRKLQAVGENLDVFFDTSPPEDPTRVQAAQEFVSQQIAESADVFTQSLNEIDLKETIEHELRHSLFQETVSRPVIQLKEQTISILEEKAKEQTDKISDLATYTNSIQMWVDMLDRIEFVQTQENHELLENWFKGSVVAGIEEILNFIHEGTQLAQKKNWDSEELAQYYESRWGTYLKAPYVLAPSVAISKLVRSAIQEAGNTTKILEIQRELFTYFTNNFLTNTVNEYIEILIQLNNAQEIEKNTAGNLAGFFLKMSEELQAKPESEQV